MSVISRNNSNDFTSHVDYYFDMMVCWLTYHDKNANIILLVRSWHFSVTSCNSVKCRCHDVNSDIKSLVMKLIFFHGLSAHGTMHMFNTRIRKATNKLVMSDISSDIFHKPDRHRWPCPCLEQGIFKDRLRLSQDGHKKYVHICFFMSC